MAKIEMQKGHLFVQRKLGQSLVLDDNIEITVYEVKGKYVRLAIKSVKEVKVMRSEKLVKVKE